MVWIVEARVGKHHADVGPPFPPVRRACLIQSSPEGP